jgi:hypothetical protein
VTIATAGIRIAFDRGIRWHGHWPRIAFIAVRREINCDRRLLRVHDDVRDADARTVVFAGTEVRMYWIAWSDEIDDGC